MILGNPTYRFVNGEMKVFTNVEAKYNIYNFSKPIRKWYRYNPYAKKLNDEWICQDYRIDQQRPQRNVYSEAYIHIIQITEIERKYLDRLIDELEKNIEYPTVYDDGKNWYYEETIYCPDCGKRRKVLTSKTHCEFCGFEFSKAKNCPKCNRLNLEDNQFCTECGHDFNENIIENIIDDSLIECSNCGKLINSEYEFCTECGYKLNVVKCKYCGMKNSGANVYCGYCGEKIN